MDKLNALFAGCLLIINAGCETSGPIVLSSNTGTCSNNLELPTFRPSPKFLVAGQSNGVSAAQGHAPYWSQTGLTKVTDYYNGKVQRVPTQADPVNSSIAWIYAGDFLNRQVEFVNIAKGGQSSTKWNEVHFENEMRPKLEADTFDAVLWIQGESDYGEHIDEETTYQNMKSIITKSRLIKSDLFWIIAQNSYKTVPKENSVRRAQCRIIEEGLSFRGPDTDKLRDNPAYVETDLGEFVGEGLKEHGRLWAEILIGGFK